MEVKIGGSMVYWLPKSVDRADMVARLSNMVTGNSIPQLPAERAQLPCLRDALYYLYKAPQTLVRPLGPGKEGYAVVRELRDENGNSYDHQTLYWLNPMVLHQIKDSGNQPTEAPLDVLTAWEDQKEACTADQITVMLQRFLKDKCQGISLRSHGSMYWIPDQYWQQWEAVTTEIERATPAKWETDHTEFRRIRTVMDTNAVVAFGASLKEEVDELEAKIKAHITDPNTGRLALERRAADALELAKKVSDYETALGTSLSDLAGTLVNLQQDAAKAAIVATVRRDMTAQAATDRWAGNGDLETPEKVQPTIAPDTKLEDLKFPWEED